MLPPDQSTSEHRDKRRQAVRLGLVAAGLALILVYAFVVPPIRAGDGPQYWLMLESWFDHGSPDLRPGDLDRVYGLLEENELVRPGWNHRLEYYETGTGLSFCLHFWLYSLLAVPAKALLRFAGGNELAALQATNALLFAAAAGFALGFGHSKRRDRLLLTALSAIGPVIWFIRWPHPEVFTWAMVLAAMVLVREEKEEWAALALAAGAAQNPPLLLLVLAVALMAIRKRSWRRVAWTAAAGAVAVIPTVFYWIHFRVPNLIVAQGMARLSNISFGRTWSFLLDFNQGMLPYVPVLVLFGLAAAGLALHRRNVTVNITVAGLFGMILLVQTASNWNGGTAGMVRYAVWMTPVFAFLIVEQIPFQRRTLRWAVLAGLLLQAAVLASRDGRPDQMQHNALARFMLTRLPAFYNPEHEIFAERTLGRGGGGWREQLPVSFATDDGCVTKALVNRRVIGEMLRLYEEWPYLRELTPYLGELAIRHQDRKGMFYVTPGRCRLRVKGQAGRRSWRPPDRI
jgi:hypothetical protein